MRERFTFSSISPGTEPRRCGILSLTCLVLVFVLSNPRIGPCSYERSPGARSVLYRDSELYPDFQDRNGWMSYVNNFPRIRYVFLQRS